MGAAGRNGRDAIVTQVDAQARIAVDRVAEDGLVEGIGARDGHTRPVVIGDDVARAGGRAADGVTGRILVGVGGVVDVNAGLHVAQAGNGASRCPGRRSGYPRVDVQSD